MYGSFKCIIIVCLMSPKGLKAIPKDVFRFKPKSSHSRALSVFYYFIIKKNNLNL